MMHGYIPENRFFPYLTWTEVEAMPHRDRVVLIQPCGAIEQHGAHLPLIVDSTISCRVLGEALTRLNPEIPAYALPPLYYGKSNEHLNFSGTVSLTTETLLAILQDLASSLHRAGFRRLILMNSHGGQSQIMEIAATDIHAKYPDFWVFPIFTWRVTNQVKSLLSAVEGDRALHAGDAETSFMLAVDPLRVKMERAVCEYPPIVSNFFGAKGTLTYSWLTEDLSKTGVMGDATVATTEKGEKILELLAMGWVNCIEAVFKMQPLGENQKVEN